MEQQIVEQKPKEYLAIFDPITAKMEEIKAENEKLVFDYNDPQGNKDARSHVHKLRQVKTKIAEAHKIGKADALAVCREIDGYKNKLIAEVEKMIAVHNEPLQRIEQEKVEKLRKIKEAEEKKEAERLAELERREAAVKEAEEKAAAKAEAERVAKEQEERERQIAEEATAKAEAKAKAESEAKAKAEKAEKERQAEIERQRQENKQHQTKIQKEIHRRLKELDGMSAKNARVILNALIAGTIPYVKIEY